MTAKITTALNDRSRDASISSTAPGIPDDTSHPPDIDEADAARMAEKFKPKGRANLERELKDATELPQKGSA